MSKIREYQILSEPEGQTMTLAAKVNEQLQDGWRLYGDPFGLAGHLHQAMVRKEKEVKLSVDRIRKTSDD
ncbi:MAG: DUF1737 domain-containing protein [bacterium]|nr:DUF1737 domain-containing protein [bacterium]